MTSEETEKRLQELEKRLRSVEDIEEIKKLQIRYVNSLMFAKWDELIDCFAENSTFIWQGGETQGKKEIAKLFRDRFSKGHVGREGDFLVHPTISVNGDKAKGNWVLYLMHCYRRTGQALFWAQGVYDMEYIKVNGQWKINVLKWTVRMGPPCGGPPYEGT